MLWKVGLVVVTNAALLLWGLRLSWVKHQLTHHTAVAEGVISEVFDYRSRGAVSPKFSYRYTVEGQGHTGVRHSPLRGRDYRVGEPVRVHYAVKSPADSWVEKHDDYGLVWMLYVVPLVFGVALWFAWPQIRRPARPGSRRQPLRGYR